VVAEITPQALAKHQDVECRADGRALVRGDATLLSVLVRNLVDNAVRYSPEGAGIRICVTTAADNSIELSVDDSGPGMKASDMERAGERFFRVVGSGQSGSGLGLSITRRIADVHQAMVRIDRSASLGGLCVVVRFKGARDGEL
jgi:two-component system sensor histidine kinase QseC